MKEISKSQTIVSQGTRPTQRLPEWLKIKRRINDDYGRVRSILKQHGIHSVCQEAHCPNIRECFGRGTATFMILGDICTRNCRFCGVSSGIPGPLDIEEPVRLAEVVAKLNLKQVVITSVTRDDQPDGGAGIFVSTMKELRARDKNVRVEFLISDLAGNTEALAVIIDSGVDVLAHNVETVGRLYSAARPGASLSRSLDLLRAISVHTPRPVVKTGFMVGLGETLDEIEMLLRQVHDVGVDIVTIGQYLRPSVNHLSVERFYTPDEFEMLAETGRKIGIAHVESGPLVRSSYRAFDQSKGFLGRL
ncbi:MAG: lipoyl synthase [Candidatus Zixiibacteriota bacterium]|nr:MAG: lipoyl synthase [candidate division Zixibacteria bacterium]